MSDRRGTSTAISWVDGQTVTGSEVSWVDGQTVTGSEVSWVDGQTVTGSEVSWRVGVPRGGGEEGVSFDGDDELGDVAVAKEPPPAHPAP